MQAWERCYYVSIGMRLKAGYLVASLAVWVWKTAEGMHVLNHSIRFTEPQPEKKKNDCQDLIVIA